MTVQAIQRLKSPEEMPGSYGLPFLGETLELFGAAERLYPPVYGIPRGVVRVA